MKKITLLVLFLFLSLVGSAQFQEGFESTNAPDYVTDTWNLGTTGFGSNGIWGVFDNAVGPNQSWTINSGIATPPLVFEGAQAAYINRENIGAGNTSRDFLATPLITVPNDGQLRFWMRTTISGNQQTKYKIMWAPASAAQNDPSAYTLIQELTENDIATFNLYEEKVISLDSHDNDQGYIAFVREYTQPDALLDGDRWLVDLVRISSQCLDPLNLSADVITQTSAELSWDNPSGATQWEIAIVPFANAQPTSGIIINSNPYTATQTTTPSGINFTPTTQYKYWVRALCSNGFPSIWIGPFSFTTSSPGLSCDSPIVIPTGLPYLTTDNTSNYADSTDVPQGACAGTPDNYMGGNEVFYTYTPTADTTISIEMTPEGNWSGIFVYQGCANVGVNCVASVANNTSNVREIPALDVIGGQTYVIVISTNAFPQTVGYTMLIQELNCLPPTNLSAVSTGPSSAALTWGNPGAATSWEVFVQTPGETIPTTPGVTVNSNTAVAVTTLANGTPLILGCYQYWVRAACGDGTFSPWEGPYSFCTTNCSTGCNYTFVMTDAFGDGWNGNTFTVTQGPSSYIIGEDFTTGSGPVTQSVTLCEGGFTVTWNDGGFFATEVGFSVVNSFGQTIFTYGPGLNEQGSLVYTGLADCFNPLCLPPTNLAASNPITGGATLTWIPNGPTPTAWHIYAVPTGGPAPDASTTPTVITTDNPYDIFGLLPDTEYTFWVRAACSDTENSEWSSTTGTFTTLPTCPKPTNLQVSDIDMTEATINWTPGGSETQWQIIYLAAGSAPPAANNPGWADATNPVTLGGLTSGTAYDVYVRAVCSAEDISTAAGPLTFNTSICPAVDQCLYTFTMTDSFGDGWNGNTMDIIQNGITVATIGSTFTTGTGPVTVTVPICHGVAFELFWNTGGAFANEVGITVTSFLNDVLYTHAPGDNLQGTTLYQGTGECIPPTCLKPTAVIVTPDLDTAVVSWTDNNAPAASQWQILVLPASAPPPLPGDTGIVVDTNPYTLTDLDSGTNYVVYVRAVCSDTDSSFWSIGVPFNTLVCAAANQCLYSFVMTDGFGDGWNGNTMAVIQNGVTVATIGSTFTTGTGPITVQVPICNGVPFELFWNIGGNFANEVGISITTFLGESVFTHAPGENLQGTTLYEGTGECIPPTCLKPTNVVVSNISLDSATVTWTDNNAPAATQWQILVLPASAPAPLPEDVGTLVTENPYILEGLDPATPYTVYVRAVCSDTDSSFWSLGTDFNTVVCLPNNLCEYTFIMTDSFGDGWNGNTMTISQNGIAVATIGSTFFTGTGPISVTLSLCNEIPFELFWNTGGFFATEVGISVVNSTGTTVFTHSPGTNGQGTLLFSGTVSCIPPTCPKPVQLQATNVTETSALLNWTEANTATQWEILVLLAGSPTPDASSTGTITTDNPYLAENLTSGTSYVFYVRALCSDTDVSNWAGPSPFATLITNDECDTASIVIVNPDQSCTQTTSGTLVGATASALPNTCGGTPDDDVWFTFTATSASATINLNNVQGSTTDLFHALYQGDNCGNLTLVYCSDDNQSVANGLIPGQTYFIRVYSWTSQPGQTSTFDVCIGTIQPPIAVSTTEYTVPELVTEVLLSSTCATVSNITWSTGESTGDFNGPFVAPSSGIGYFTQNGSSFPFADGVVLSTGTVADLYHPGDTQPSVRGAAGPNESGQSFTADGWLGDADLEDIVEAQGQFNGTNNASILEFDFVPLINQMSFNFLFASEEYGVFQCNFSDVFAFILTDLDTNIATNLAVLPSTTTPISVTTIRDDLYNGGCASANPEYFDNYYAAPEGQPFGAPINFNGTVVPLTASSAVIPGHSYHIKMAIADYSDSAFDSAVFLQGGSFGIGNIALGENLLQSTGNAVCAGGTTTLTTTLDPELYDFQWSDLNGPIVGETNPSFTVDQEGTYTLTVNFEGTTCSGSDDVIVEFYNPVVPGEPNDLFICSTSATGTFDLTQNTSVVTAPLGSGWFATYFLTEADATNNTNAIGTPAAYVNVSNPQTIYTRVENVLSGCFGIVSFDLILEDLTPQFTIGENVTICSGTTQTISVTPINFDLADATYSWTFNTDPLPDNTSSITVSAAGTYTVTVSRFGCSATMSVTIDVIPQPVADVLNDVTVCDSYVLPGLSANNAYWTGPNGTGTMWLAGQSVTSGQSFYIWASQGSCTDQSTFIVTVNQTPVLAAVSDVIHCGAYTLPVLSVGSYYNGPDATLGQVASPVSASQQVYVYAQTGTDPNCFAQASFQVTINDTPEVDELNDVDACNSYTLPGLTVGAYWTQSGGTGTQLPAGTVITQGQTIYIWSADGTCSDESDFVVGITDSPAFTIESGCQGSQYVLTVVPTNGFDAATAEYTWTSASGGVITGTGQSVVVSGADTYSVSVQVGDCPTAQSLVVDGTGCLIQKGISPNGDGNNDYFDLEGQNVSKLQIFNRYGMVVYKKDNYSNQWYGQSDDGEELPDGTYYYVIDRAQGEARTGWIYINRERN
jgi:gliding motility-associated-like protein